MHATENNEMSLSPAITPSPFPHPTSSQPFWRTDLHQLDNHRSTEDLPAECDVLIIGAGYAGVSTAYHLLDANVMPPKIVILEARQACSGATARNGGHIRPEVYFSMPTYVKKYGVETAVEISKFENSHIGVLKHYIEKHKIDCEFTLTRSMDVFLDEETAMTCKKSYDLLSEFALIPKDVQFTPAKYAEGVSGVKGAKACFSFPAAHIWPYKFIMHLLSVALSRGANLQTTTPVLSVSRTVDPDDKKWTVLTPRGVIKATKVVFASNGYTAGIAPEYEHKIVPCRGICSRITASEKGGPLPYLSNSYCIRRDGTYDYLIPRADGSIIVGGARAAFWHDRKTWYDVTNDDEMIKPAANYFDGFMQRNFRGWENSGAVTEMVWTGIMGYTSDSLPHVGVMPTIPSTGYPPTPPCTTPSSMSPSSPCSAPSAMTQPPTPPRTSRLSKQVSPAFNTSIANPPNTKFIAAGFNGHGMPVIFRATRGLADMILDDQVTFEDTGLPKVYRTSLERLRSSQDDLGAFP